MPTDIHNYAWLLLPVSLLHIAEEHYWPGGFLNWLRASMPELSGYITRRWSLHINCLFFILCLSGTFYVHFAYITCFVMLLNALLHIAGTIQTKRYCPGVITAIFLYLPFSIIVLYNTLPELLFIIIYLGIAALLHSSTIISLLASKGKQY